MYDISTNMQIVFNIRAFIADEKDESDPFSRLQLRAAAVEPYSLRRADDGFLALGTPAQNVYLELTLILL